MSKASKTVKLRKRVQTPPPEEQKQVRTVKVLRKLNTGDVGPEPGSIEEDFLLESGGDVKTFWRGEDEEEPGPRYAPEGRLIPYSVIGSPEAFEKLNAADIKAQEKANPSQDETTTRRYRTLRKVKTPGLTPQEKMQRKLQQIEEGKAAEAQAEELRLSALPVGLRLMEERQRKCLRGFTRMQAYWSGISDRLLARTGKQNSPLLLASLQDFREKIEELDYLDRAISSDEKAGVYAWYMSLRCDEGGRETYLPVGDKLSGLYTRIKERNNSAEPIIRRPNSPEWMHRSFKDAPYFQKRMKAEEMHKSLHPVQCSNVHDLKVCGVGKYSAELAAVKYRGVEKLDLEQLKVGELNEEVYAVQYDTRFKY